VTGHPRISCGGAVVAEAVDRHAAGVESERVKRLGIDDRSSNSATPSVMWGQILVVADLVGH
jgi:hypothetical protein